MLDVRRISFLRTPCFLAYGSSLFIGYCMLWCIFEWKKAQLITKFNNFDLLKGNEIFLQTRQVDQHSTFLFYIKYKKNVIGSKRISGTNTIAENKSSFASVTKNNKLNILILKNGSFSSSEKVISLRSGRTLYDNYDDDEKNKKSKTIGSNLREKNSLGDKSNLGSRNSLVNESSLESGNNPVNVPSDVNDSNDASTLSKRSESNSGGLNFPTDDTVSQVKDHEDEHILNPGNSEPKNIWLNENSSSDEISIKTKSSSINKDAKIIHPTNNEDPKNNKVATKINPSLNNEMSIKEKPPIKNTPTVKNLSKIKNNYKTPTISNNPIASILIKNENNTETENPLNNETLIKSNNSNSRIVSILSKFLEHTITDLSDENKGNENLIKYPSNGTMINNYLKLNQFFAIYTDFIFNRLTNVNNFKRKKQHILNEVKEIFQYNSSKRNKRSVIKELREKINEMLIGEEMKNDIREALAELVKTFNDDDELNLNVKFNKQD